MKGRSVQLLENGVSTIKYLTRELVLHAQFTPAFYYTVQSLYAYKAT